MFSEERYLVLGWAGVQSSGVNLFLVESSQFLLHSLVIYRLRFR